MNQPIDIYSSDISTPFEVAAYCRGHKYSVEAVNLARALRERQAARRALKIAEHNETLAEQCVKSAILALRLKMERDPS